MKQILKITLIVFLFVTACKKDDGSDVGEPGSAKLVFPENNSECTEGTVINNLESTITFQWETSSNTDSYEVNVRNLNSDNTMKATVNANEADITLERNVPYEWFVVSKSAEGGDLTSAKWKFYNAGHGVENYAPFPAEAVNPTRGQTVGIAGSISLEWLGSDVDNDISEYEVFFGTDVSPTASLGSTAQNTMNVDISSGQTYYWRVITKDNESNTSQSEIFDFRVL
jgi:hypothetical protein